MKSFIVPGLSAVLLVAALSFSGAASASAAHLPPVPIVSGPSVDILINLSTPSSATPGTADASATIQAPLVSGTSQTQVRTPHFALPAPSVSVPNSVSVTACILATCERSVTASCSADSPCVTACVIASCSAADSPVTPTEPTDGTTPTGGKTPVTTSDSSGTLLARFLGSPGAGDAALAFTGANAVPLIASGLIVLALGALLLAARRRAALQA